MAIDATPTSSQKGRRAVWIALALVLGLCAWLAAHSDDGSSADIARPLTHAAGGALPPGRSNSSGTDPTRERRVVASLRQSLAASPERAGFPPLTDIGRSGWAGIVPPAAVASASLLAVAAVPPPTFPFQWVGLLTQPGKARDGADAQPTAIIAGPHSTWMVKQGDVLDEDWKIAALSATQIEVIHLPTSSRQTISMSKQ